MLFFCLFFSSLFFFFFLFPEEQKCYLPGTGLHSMDPDGSQTLKENFQELKCF